MLLVTLKDNVCCRRRGKKIISTGHSHAAPESGKHSTEKQQMMLSSVSELGPCYLPIELPWNMGAGMRRERRDRAVEESERAERLRETDGTSLDAKREDSGQGRNVRRRGEIGGGWRKEMVGNSVGEAREYKVYR